MTGTDQPRPGQANGSPKLQSLQRVREWYEANGFASVDLIEEPELPAEPWRDFEVAIKARFVPRQPGALRAEVWITDAGKFGIGIESYERIAAMIGARTSTDRFVAGFLPLRSEFAEIAPVLDLGKGIGELGPRQRLPGIERHAAGGLALADEFFELAHQIIGALLRRRVGHGVEPSMAEP